MKLPEVMMLAILVMLILLSALGNWVFQMNLDRVSEGTAGARRLSEAAVQVMISRLIHDPALSAGGLPGVNISLPGYPQGSGLAALHPDTADDWEIGLTINNLQGAVPVPGRAGLVVEKETASLVGVGRWRGREVRTEVILNVPAFPYVISSSVPVTALDGLKVFGIQSPAALLADYDSIPPSNRLPGHISTGALDPTGGTALQLLGASTLIEGDAQASGGVRVAGGATVKGEVRPRAQAPAMPALTVTSLDTVAKPGLNTIAVAALGATELSGFNRRSGPLSISGGLELDGGVLYVEGDLTVSGGIRGKGAVITTGSLQVEGGSSLSGDAQTALVSGGSMRLRGAPGHKSEFRGLVYTEGNLDARFTNIAGAVVVNNPSATGSAVLEHVSLAEAPALASLELPVSVTTPPGPRDPRLRTPPDMRGYAAGNALAGLSGPTMTAPDGTTQEVKPEFVWYPAAGDGSDMSIPPGFVITHPDTTPGQPWIEIAPVDPLPADLVALGGVRQFNLNPSDPIREMTVMNLRNVALQGTQSEFRDEAALRSGMSTMFASWFPGVTDGDERIDQYLAEIRGQMPAYLRGVADAYNYNARLIATSPTPVSTGSSGGSSVVPWKLDLGDFFNLSERIRVRSWVQI